LSLNEERNRQNAVAFYEMAYLGRPSSRMWERSTIHRWPIGRWVHRVLRGVLISIGYLSIQIRQNTKAVRRSRYHQAAEQTWSALLAVSQNANLAEALVKAQEEAPLSSAEAFGSARRTHPVDLASRICPICGRKGFSTPRCIGMSSITLYGISRALVSSRCSPDDRVRSAGSCKRTSRSEPRSSTRRPVVELLVLSASRNRCASAAAVRVVPAARRWNARAGARRVGEDFEDTVIVDPK